MKLNILLIKKERSNMNLLELQNGSDIRGIALKDEKDKKEVNLTPETAANIAGAFAEFLKEKIKKEKLTITLGRDSRITGKAILEISAAYLKSLNHEALDCEIASTPSIFMTTQDKEIDADGGIMITASHLPYERNGMKFFTKEGSLNKKDIKKILEIAEKNYKKNIIEENLSKNVKKVNYIKRYSDILAEKIVRETEDEKPLSGMKII